MFWCEILIIHIFSLTNPINSTHSLGHVNRTILESQKTFKQASTQSLGSACVLCSFTKVLYWIIWKSCFASPCMTKSSRQQGSLVTNMQKSILAITWKLLSLSLSVLFCTHCSHVPVTSEMSLKKINMPAFAVSLLSSVWSQMGPNAFFLSGAAYTSEHTWQTKKVHGHSSSHFLTKRSRVLPTLQYFKVYNYIFQVYSL